VAVVVAGVGLDGALELAAVEDEDSVEALAADAADPTLHVRVGVRRPDRGSDDLHALTAEEGVEGMRELCVSVTDQDTRLFTAVVEIHAEVSGLLEHPGAVGVGGAREVVDPAAPNADEHEDIQPSQPNRVDGEEVAREHRRGVLAHK
jgi:hypothetical protein